jgi:energy-coupling factor transporter ATP-binding protein EcfA2
MGMRRADIVRRLDEIIDFAGVDQFVDTPVKRYSSGMNARLGFAIAAHLDPNVLVVDEVLSVGDAAFQKRCVERMHGFKRQGVSIVFVSHNLQAVSELCDEALFVHREAKALGPTSDVLRQYIMASSQVTSTLADEVTVVQAEFVDRGRALTIGPGEYLTLRVHYQANRDVSDITLGFLIHRSTDLLVVYDGNFRDQEIGLGPLKRGDHFSVDFQFWANLVRGQYHLDCHVYHNPTQQFLGRLNPAGLLNVVEDRTFTGVADIGLNASLAARPAVETTV